jgi:uncharacterized protein YkwD
MPIADAPPHHAQGRIDRVEMAIYRAMNNARARHGIPRLRLIRSLSGAASAQSSDQANHHTLDHTSSNGTPFYTRIRRAANARSVGENLIAYHGSMSGRAIVRAWMHSPPHRAEILSGVYRRVGVGRARSGRFTVATADFAS